MDVGARFNHSFDLKVAGRWLLLGSVVGVVSGLGAILFQSLLSLVQELSLVHWMGLEAGAPGGEEAVVRFIRGPFIPWVVVLLPALGGLLSGWIVFRFAPEAEGHGTDAVIDAYHRNRGIIRPLVPVVKLFASVITIGTGGSGGREGPIAQIGAGFGSFLAGRLGLNTRMRRWLMVAGMGAGIGSIFRAPLAGAIFAAEVLYSDPELDSDVILPAAVSSIIAYSIFSLVFGWGHMFVEPSNFGFSNPLELLPYGIMAVLLAVAAFLYVKTFYGIRAGFQKLKIPNRYKPALGGLLTGGIGLTLILLFNDRHYIVDVLGGGYGIIQEILLHGTTNVTITVLLVIGLGKILTTSLSIGSGGSAGVFGPSMVIGGTLGTAMGFLMQQLMPDVVQHPAAFTIVGMAGFFAAAANTPISTIIMVSELTGNYELLLPSMWVCTLAYLVAKKWSIYQSQVPNHNFSQAHFGQYAPDILETTPVAEAFKRTRNFTCVPQNSSFEQIMNIVEQSRQRVFPVVDKDNRLVGSFNIEDVTHLLHEPDPQSVTAQEIMHENIPAVRAGEPLGKAYRLMRDNLVNEVLVLSDESNPRVVGIITSADITLTYNRKLSEIKFGGEEPDYLPEEQTLVSTLKIGQVLEKDLMPVSPEQTLGEMVQAIIHSKRNLFPVLDRDNKLVGIVILNDIRSVMFDHSQYDTLKVSDFMTKPPAVVRDDETMAFVLDRFEKTGAWNLPVVDKNDKYIGMVSKSRIFSSYRKALIRLAEK